LLSHFGSFKENMDLKHSLEDYQERLKKMEDVSQSKVLIDEYSRSYAEKYKFKLQQERKSHEEEMTKTCIQYEETIQTLRSKMQEKSHEKKIIFDIGTQTINMKVENSAQTTDPQLTDTQKRDVSIVG